MIHISTVADAIGAGGQVDTVYTYFTKAYNKVDHDIPLLKLRSFGIPVNLVEWLSTYLRSRS